MPLEPDAVMGEEPMSEGMPDPSQGERDAPASPLPQSQTNGETAPSRFVAMDTYLRKGKWAVCDMKAGAGGRQVAFGMSRTMARKIATFLNGEAGAGRGAE